MEAVGTGGIKPPPAPNTAVGSRPDIELFLAERGVVVSYEAKTDGMHAFDR